MPRTVALDIETTGLNRYSEKITVVCLYGHIDPASQRIASRTFNMLTGGADAKAEELAEILDTAERISCFNGTRFDIPFLQVQLGFGAERVGGWILKMFDVYDIARGLLNASFKLDTVLRLNGFETKSASGLQAVQWAKDPRHYRKLEEYCMQDTRLTFLLSQTLDIKLPVAHAAGKYHLLQEGGIFRLTVST